MPTKPSDKASDKALDKVIFNLKDPESVLEPALVPALVQEVQAASDREAVGTETKVERPRRSRAINKFFSDNYVLDTESIGAQLPRRSRSLSVTSNRRSGKGTDPTKPPSIRPFLKPTGAFTVMGQNETLPMPKVTAAKSYNEPKIFEVKVSQTLMQDFFSKN
jgi:hypothetical protein